MPVCADLFPDLFEPFTRTAHFPEKAKRVVEVAIARGEAAAISFLKL